MSAVLLDGKKLSEQILKSLAPRAQTLRAERGRPVKLAVVAGDGAAASSYLKSLAKAAAGVGIEAPVLSVGAAGLAAAVAGAGRDLGVDAVLIDHPNASSAASALPAGKDVEGLTPEQYGRLFLIKSYEELASSRVIAPCTALAVAELLRSSNVPLTGKRAVVIGRSAILGRPAAHLLSALDLTVTLCHGKTADLASEVSRADVVVACIGKPGFIRAAWIKPGALVIDAGINMVAGKLKGDVEAAAKERAGCITPVSGGVGPVTTALLLANALTLAERAR